MAVCLWKALPFRRAVGDDEPLGQARRIPDDGVDCCPAGYVASEDSAAWTGRQSVTHVPERGELSISN
jgi:hypothetical protein